MRRKQLDFSFEEKVWDRRRLVIGVDEVGRGALAGPVCAGACVFPPQCLIDIVNKKIRIDDSKKLTPLSREKSHDWIVQHALVWGFYKISPQRIDAVGIVNAVDEAMSGAVLKCVEKLESINIHNFEVCLDYFGKAKMAYLPNISQTAYIKGDEKIFSVAAASILAKVKRDVIMKNYSLKYPKYQWDKNKGYGTKEHIKVIETSGISPLHRKSFLSSISM